MAVGDAVAVLFRRLVAKANPVWIWVLLVESLRDPARVIEAQA